MFCLEIQPDQPRGLGAPPTCVAAMNRRVEKAGARVRRIVEEARSIDDAALRAAMLSATPFLR